MLLKSKILSKTHESFISSSKKSTNTYLIGTKFQEHTQNTLWFSPNIWRVLHYRSLCMLCAWKPHDIMLFRTQYISIYSTLSYSFYAICILNVHIYWLISLILFPSFIKKINSFPKDFISSIFFPVTYALIFDSNVFYSTWASIFQSTLRCSITTRPLSLKY